MIISIFELIFEATPGLLDFCSLCVKIELVVNSDQKMGLNGPDKLLHRPSNCVSGSDPTRILWVRFGVFDPYPKYFKNSDPQVKHMGRRV